MGKSTGSRAKWDRTARWLSKILGKDEQLLVEQNAWFRCDIYRSILTAEVKLSQALNAF